MADSFISIPRPIPHLKRIMVFIDGAYFRDILQKHFEGDFTVDPKRIIKPIELLSTKINEFNFFPHSNLEIIRIYFYDGLVEKEDPSFKDRVKFFKDFLSVFDPKIPIEIKYGRLIKIGDRYRQKGVDVFLSVDFVVKAFQNHYDVALLIAGDDDFVDAVKIVKDYTGKRIIGLYKKTETSSRLIDCFDYKCPYLPQPFFGDFKI